MAVTLSEIAWDAKRHWGYPDEWMEAWRPELTLSVVDFEEAEIWAAGHATGPEGFYVLRPLSKSAGEIAHFWVRPASMGRGVGRLLLQHALARAEALKLTSVTVVADPNAAAFYAKFGARPIGVEKGVVCGRLRELPILEFTISPK